MPPGTAPPTPARCRTSLTRSGHWLSARCPPEKIPAREGPNSKRIVTHINRTGVTHLGGVGMVESYPIMDEKTHAKHEILRVMRPMYARHWLLGSPARPSIPQSELAPAGAAP